MFQIKTVSSIILGTIVFAFIQSCSGGAPIDSEAVKKEIANREIKRVSQGELMEKAMEIGNQLALRAQNDLQLALKTKIQGDGVNAAIPYCQINAMPIVNKSTDSLSVSIMRVSEKYRNPKNEPDSLEALILEAYQFELESGGELKESVIEESKYILLYTKPIIISSSLCLNCHGLKETDIPTGVLKEINMHYPNDNATDYAIGDLRGMWTIRIPKKSIVNLL